LLAVSCVALPRYKAVDPRPEPYPVERLAEELDPWLLADGFSKRLIVEIDWVEGCRPGPRTLAGFEKVLRRYVPATRTIEVALDQEIPRAVWDEAAGDGDPVAALVERFVNVGPVLAPDTERRYVLFAPLAHGNFGYWRTETSATVQPGPWSVRASSFRSRESSSPATPIKRTPGYGSTSTASSVAR
jgi:hypothetical protein